MKNHIHTIKVALVSAVIFGLGVTASGGLGRVADALSSTAQAQPNKGCQTSDLAGKWGYSYHGEFTNVGKLVGVGVETFDKFGHSVGKDIYAVDGNGGEVAFTGQFSLDQDCTGSAFLQFADGTTSNTRIVMTDGGNEVDFISFDPGTTLLGIAKRQ